MLPADDALRALAREGRGLTRPELAVLLAYAKLDLSHAVTESALPDDPYFAPLLQGYFPPLAARRFADEIPRHRLAREIVATELVNRLVNLAGPLFAHRLRELSSAPLDSAVRAFAVADGVFGFQDMKARIAACGAAVPASVETAIMADIAELLRRLGLWFLVQPQTAGLGETVSSYRAYFETLKARLGDILSPADADALRERSRQSGRAGLPAEIARDVALLPLLPAVPEIILLAQTQSLAIAEAAEAYFAAGGVLGLGRLRDDAAGIAAKDHWDRLALRRIVDDLYGAQRVLAGYALARAQSIGAQSIKDGGGAAAVRAWADAHAGDVGRLTEFLGELEQGGELSIARLALANSQIQKIAASPG
jgi:glutamate dehydrogenase